MRLQRARGAADVPGLRAQRLPRLGLSSFNLRR